MDAVRRKRPDVAVVDVRMPPTHRRRRQAAREIRNTPRGHPPPLPDRGGGTCAALFSEHPEGFGYLLKDRVLEIDDFLEAVRRVGRGGTAIDPQVIAQLLGRRERTIPWPSSHLASGRCSG